MNAYAEFLESKQRTAPKIGFHRDEVDLNPTLFEWQSRLVKWALHRGRGAIFADCGLGKTPMQLEWASQICQHTGRPVLIVAPLAVSLQTQREGSKFGIAVNVCRNAADVKPGVNITNYEKLHLFEPAEFSGIVLDESSILKGNGPLFREVHAFGTQIGYRLCCTATPAPNDIEELINHAEFLGIMTGTEILALYFTQDGNTTHKWRLKRHAERDWWRWVATWAVAMRDPSDIGFPDARFTLPEVTYHQHTVDAPMPTTALFQSEAVGIQEQRQCRRDTLEDRVEVAARLADDGQPWLIWCDLNAESQALTKAIPDAVEITGSDPPDVKVSRMMGFLDGSIRVLVSKPEICGFGMNFQHCNRMAFVGLGNSYERYYQAVRRCWRFGQTRPVQIHVVTSEADGPVVRNIERKERESRKLMQQLVTEIGRELTIGDAQDREDMHYEEGHASGKGWDLYLGDCVEGIRKVADESVGHIVFSPPFPSMYVYTNSPRDIGNCASFEELINHFSFLMQELLRVTLPGRSCCIHLTQALAFKSKDGYIGIKDFRGKTIEAMERAGWIYYGEVTIDKNPQVKAIRTKDRGLLFKTLATDSSHMHMALADYLLQFRKPGDNATPIKAGISAKYGNTNGWISAEEWIRWARPVWYAEDYAPDGDGIRETDVLNVAVARDTNDERHLCPLQLGVIERSVKLWSNPGDLVLSPFAGIGSEGHQAVRFGRRFVGFELKRSYFETACSNLRKAEHSASQPSLFGEDD